jgi:cytochrome P450
MALTRPPADPVAAVTHPDPYPYYAGLVAERPLHRDAGLGLWVATGAAVVTAVLTSELGRVRPAAEPVPRALVGTPAGEIFRQLVRMNDGATHLRLKPGVSAKLAMLAPPRIAEEAGAWARHLAAELDPAGHDERLADFAFRLPTYTVAALVGVAPDALAPTAAWVGDFVRCLAPTATPAEIERGTTAAGELTRLFCALLRRDELDATVANTIGYLSQAYEATAGLIGNTLVALGRHPELRARLGAEPSLLRAVVREVVRHDPPVQNTRRFVAGDGVVAGQALHDGETVLVVLAAANRDPSVNPHPDRFDPQRRERQAYTFGVGAHACPGELLASMIAEAGLVALLAAGVEPERLVERVTYRPSANTRIPLFGSAGAPS